MKQTIKYQCEICQQLYDSPDDALKCEERGKEKPLVELGQTVLYRDDWNGGFGTCFDKLDVIEIKNYDHYVDYTLGDWETKYPCEYINGNIIFKDLCTSIGIIKN